MRIKKMTASFGALENQSLALEKGLNIIQAPNEAGKSTWCAFIKAMLYGINTADRDKAGYLSDKTKYRPWSGKPMEGAMDLSIGGKEITLTRTAQGNAPMKRLEAVYTGTHEPVLGLDPESTGEQLTGMSEKVFVRSAFIRQAQIPIGQTAELERRISALVSTGEESASYMEADSRLREWQRKRRYNQHGELPKVEGQIQEAEARLQRIEEATDALCSAKAELESLEAQKAQLQEKMAQYARAQNAQQAQRLKEMRLRLRETKNEIARLELTLRKNGYLPQKGDTDKAMEQLGKLQAMAVGRSGEKQRMDEAAAAKRELEQTAEQSIFYGLTADEAVKESARAQAEMQTAKAASTRTSKGRKAVGILLLCLAVIAGSALFWLQPVLASQVRPERIEALLSTGRLIAAGVALAAAAVGILLLALAHGVKRRALQATERLAELEKRYRTNQPETLQTELEQYLELLTRLEAAGRTAEADQAVLATMESELLSGEEILKDAIRVFAPDFGNIENAYNVIAETADKIDRLEKARIQEESLQELAETLQQTVQETLEEEGPIQRPAESLEEMQAAFNRISAQAESLSNRYTLATGEIRAFGDPVVIGASLQALQERRDNLEEQYAALSLAVETLREANQEIQSRFAPLLSREAGKIMDAFTGGRYKRLTFDRDLDAAAEPVGDVVSREALSLSQGTLDQLYLALRLAICRLLSDPENPCPLVLDDVLANFDDQRAAQALEVFCQEAEGRQVILFTCHSREAQLLAGRENVHVIQP